MSSKSSTKLNLGCGQFKKKGYVNLDGFAGFNPDIVHDLDVFPYPFADNTFEVIEIDHVLEHLAQPLHAIREMHRISKQDGLIRIKVPHFSRGFTHPEHRNGFDVSLPYYFSPTFAARYENDVVMELVRMRLRWAAQPHIKALVLSRTSYAAYFGLGFIIDIIANLAPSVCSRIWCYWVGGFDEIEYVFRVTK